MCACFGSKNRQPLCHVLPPLFPLCSHGGRVILIYVCDTETTHSPDHCCCSSSYTCSRGLRLMQREIHRLETTCYRCYRNAMQGFTLVSLPACLSTRHSTTTQSVHTHTDPTWCPLSPGLGPDASYVLSTHINRRTARAHTHTHTPPLEEHKGPAMWL